MNEIVKMKNEKLEIKLADLSSIAPVSYTHLTLPTNSRV